MSNSNNINENKPIHTTTTQGTAADTVMHSPKRRSLSSYLSKLHTRKGESNIKKDINISKNEVSNTANKPSREKSIEPLSEKIENNDILKDSIMNIVNENRIKIKKEANEDDTMAIKDEANSHIDDSKMTNSSSQEKSTEATTTNNSHLTPFSREELKSVLKEPQTDYNSTTSTSSSMSTTDKYESNQNGNTGKPTSSSLEQEMINSDTETPRGSPIKVRRGRLIRGDKLQTLSNISNYYTVYNESDSELSDVNDIKDLNINSSFLNSSSIKDAKETVSPIDKSIKPKAKSSSNYNSNNSSNSRGSRNKKSVYRDSGGRTRLQIACDKGKIDVVKKMLAESLDNPDSNIDVNDQDNAGNTPLHEAALNGHLDIVKLLIDHGANVNIQSFEYFKDTPLIDASANGHLEVVEYLLSKGADPTVVNAKGLTAYEAIEEDSDLDEQERELVRDIKDTLRKGTLAWVNTHRHNNDKLTGHNLQSPNNVYGQNSKNNTQRSNGATSNLDNNTTNNSNDSNSHSHYHHKDILLNHDTNKIKNDIEFLWTDLTSKTGKEKLMQASKEGNLVYVGQYLENGGRIDFKAFIESVKFGHEDIASLFLAFGAQVNKLNKDDYTPLMVSVGRGHFGTVKLLLEAGADPTIKNKKGYDALFYSKNSPLGVVDDDEIELLMRSVKLHGGTVESNSSDVKKERQEHEVKERQDKGKEDKETNEEDAKTYAHKNDTSKNKSKKKNSDNDSLALQKNDDIKRIFDDNDDDDVIVKKELEKSQKEIKNTNLVSEDEDKDEDITIPTSKYRHNSPFFSSSIPSKRRLSSESNENGSGKDKNNDDENITNKHIDKKPKHENMENEKKRQERLKAEEEEYLQRKLESKRRKELELIQKLQEDEKKRVEEKEKQKLKEAKKLEQVFKEKELELERQERRLQIEKRRRIRNMYPLGLKLIKFNGQLNLISLTQIPIYYIVKDSNKYVFDLQLLFILRDSQMLTKLINRQDITILPIINSNERLQLWNVLKPQFLFGDLNRDNEYMNVFYNCSLSQRIQFENEEYKKFNELPMNWIRWNELVCKTDIINPELKTQVEKNMTELSILSYDATNKKQPIISITRNQTASISSIEKTFINASTINTDKQKHVKNPPLILPINLQHSYRVINLLQREKITESKPMW